MSEQEQQAPGEIRGVLIQLQHGQLLLPNAAVAEVVDFRKPEPVEDAPEWLMGTTNWRQRNLAVVRLESLLGQQVTEGVRQRIVVCHTLSDEARRPFVGIVATAIPRLVRVNEELLEGVDTDQNLGDAPLHAQLMFDGQPAMIPDLSALERLLADVA